MLRGKYCWISRHGAGSSMYPAGIVPRDCGRNTHSARRAACEICQSTRRHRHYRGVCWCVVTLMPRNAGRRRKLSVRDGARRTSRSSECLDSPALGPLNENDRFAKWAFPPTLPSLVLTWCRDFKFMSSGCCLLWPAAAAAFGPLGTPASAAGGPPEARQWPSLQPDFGVLVLTVLGLST